MKVVRLKVLLVTVFVSFLLHSNSAFSDYLGGECERLYFLENFEAAYETCSVAAEQGDAEAQLFLGVMYFNGNGITQDYTEASRWYHAAAIQGYSAVQHNMAVMYSNGYGVPQDLILAHVWYNIANANGYIISAQFRDRVASKMTADQITQAQALARQCINSIYTDCGY